MTRLILRFVALPLLGGISTLSAQFGASSPQIAGAYVNKKNTADALILQADGHFSLSEGGKLSTGTYRATGTSLQLITNQGTVVNAKISGPNIIDPGGQVWSIASETQIPSNLLEPPAEVGVYYYSGGRWIKLKQAVAKAKNSGFIKRGVIGVGKTKLGVEIDGTSAALQLSEPRPTFYIRTDLSAVLADEEVRAAVSAYSSATAGSASLVRVTIKKDSREIMRTSGLIGSEQHLENETVKLAIKQLGQPGLSMAISMVPEADLLPGEYALSFGLEGFGINYDFGVVNPR